MLTSTNTVHDPTATASKTPTLTFFSRPIQLKKEMPTFSRLASLLRTSNMLERFGDTNSESRAVETVSELIDPAKLLDLVRKFLAGLVYILSDTIAVLLILAFLLVGSRSFNA